LSGRQVDKESLLKELNGDLGTEYQSLVQYIHHVATITGAEYLSVGDALQADLRLESNQLDRYRERITQATEAGLPDVSEALRPLLEQTQEHVRDLMTALGQ
jgi:bacterioferritin